MKTAQNPKVNVNIAIVGKYVDLADSYKSLHEAITHGAIVNEAKVTIDYVDSEELEKQNVEERLAQAHAIIVPGGFGARGTEGKVRAVRYARENQVPILGICFGLHMMVIEAARNLLGLKRANSREIADDTPDAVIDLMETQREVTNKGGTMRLGAYPCVIKPGTLTASVYRRGKTSERHRHRYEVNNAYRDRLEKAGLIATGTWPEANLVEIMELEGTSLVHRMSVSPGVEIAPARLPSAVSRPGACGGRASRPSRQETRNGQRIAVGIVNLAPVTIGRVVFGGASMPLIAGPCVIESDESCIRHAVRLVEITSKLEVPFVFKCSFDKANRTSDKSFRGPGLDRGLEILARVKRETGAPVLTDIHEVGQVKAAAEVVDILQVPALLSRQTDLIHAAGATGRAVNIKKGQFMAPWDMKPAVAKVEGGGNRNILLTERGATFGYNNLVTDFRSLVIMRGFGYPVIFDATHSVQLPGAGGERSGGQREFVAPLARAAVAVGVDGLFMEVHQDPDHALSDGPNSYRLDELPLLLAELKRIREVCLHGSH